MAARVSPSQSSQTQPGQVTLPKLVLDPVWSLKQWPVEIDINNQVFHIPAMPAVEWLSVMMRDDFGCEDIFPGMLDLEQRLEVERLLHAGELEVERLWELGLEVLTQVSGRQWYVALRLTQVARESWDALGGDLAAVRSDASLAAWLDILFSMVVRNIDDSKRNMFLMKLEIAPEGWGTATEESMEMSADAFLAMAG